METYPESGFSKVRWILIGIFFIITVLSGFFYSGVTKDLIPIASVLSLFSAIILHGKVRYGTKNIFIFFVITWLVSHFFEALSIQTGFPFGHYYYDKLIGPRIFQVPLIIMLAYFGMGYASWILSNILMGQYNKKLEKEKIFIIPFVATFIMVIWDVCMDPLSSTIGSLWVWTDGGPYFGVPLQNYFGWFFVVYIIFQIFAVYISKYDKFDSNQLNIFSNKIFWLEIVALYGIQGISQLMNPLTQTEHMGIYGPMAMITIFTMLFVTLISFIIIKNSDIKKIT